MGKWGQGTPDRETTKNSNSTKNVGRQCHNTLLFVIGGFLQMFTKNVIPTYKKVIRHRRGNFLIKLVTFDLMCSYYVFLYHEFSDLHVINEVDYFLCTESVTCVVLRILRTC